MPTPQPNPSIPVREPDVIRPPTPQEEPQPDKVQSCPSPDRTLLFLRVR